MSDITKYKHSDADIVNIDVITVEDGDKDVNYNLNGDQACGPPYITFQKNDAIALAKHFGLTEDDLK